jgi:hypothetical protein
VSVIAAPSQVMLIVTTMPPWVRCGMASGWVGEWSRELIRSAWLADGRSRVAQIVFHSATRDRLRDLTWLTDIRIELHASDPPSGRRRAWRVVAGADLFGLWTAHVTFGRIGAPEGEPCVTSSPVRRRLRRSCGADCGGEQPRSGGWVCHTSPSMPHLRPISSWF